MYSNTDNRKKIVGAILVGVACIALAFIFRNQTNTAVQNEDAIVVTAAPTREAVTIYDSNNDGVPDWQEALQGTDALEIASTTSGYVAPETLTDQFALQFFEQMVRSGNNGAFGPTPEELVNVSSDALLQEAVDEPITRDDISVSGDNSVAALAAYGEAVARVINTYEETGGENETEILQRAVQSQTSDELAKLDPKIAAYQDFLTYTQELTVPSSLVEYHLTLLNVYQAQTNNLTAMRNVFSDPMLALVRLKRYQEDVDALGQAIVGLYTDIINRGGTWEPNSVVYTLIETS